MMSSRLLLSVALAFVLLASFAPSGYADGPKMGFSISVEGDGFFLNPVVTRILIADVVKPSLASEAGILAGDEILQIESIKVVGRRASELKPYLAVNPGETRTLRLKHADGTQFVARLTKPKT